MKRYQARHPDSALPHFHLAVCYAELNQLAEARVAAAEWMRLNPKFSPDAFATFWPMKDPEVVERTIAALRKAGVK
jgi:hypothetical protein